MGDQTIQIKTAVAQTEENTSTPLHNEEQQAQNLAQIHGLEFVRLSEIDLPAQVVQLLPVWLVTQQTLIAVKFENDLLHVATDNPMNLPAFDQINLVTGFQVQPMVATHSDIVQAINRHYGAEQITRQDLMDARFDQSLGHEATGPMELTLSEESGQVVRLVNSIFKDAIDSAASDIHFEPALDDLRVRLRIDGILRDSLMVPSALRKEVITRIKVLAKMDITEKRKAQDGHIILSYQERPYDLRVSVIPTIDGAKTVIRVLDKHRIDLNLSSLGVDREHWDQLDKAIHKPYGMILVTGPTGSGKTTTLYAMLQSINAVEKNIITLENPVEYRLDRINQIQIDPETGHSFAQVLRSVLRQDPDVIMVGEIRDPETAEIAVQAALTGHLVLTTLHTNDAATAINRLNELGIPPYLISSCVILAVAQRLVRKLCPHCRCQVELSEDPTSIPFTVGPGCTYCMSQGYSGRTAVFEILPVKAAIRKAIERQFSADQIKGIAQKHGMQTLHEAALLKAQQGLTSLDEVRRITATEEDV